LGIDKNPFWSPNGGEIFFLSNRKISEDNDEKKNRLWKIPVQGGEAHLVAQNKYSIENPKISPDGKTILFISSIEEDSEAREDEETDVIWINKLIYKRDGVVDFIPDTRKQLFTVSAMGGEPKQLTSGPFDIIAAEWNAHGDGIYFVTNMEDYDHSLIRDVYLISREGGKPKKLTNGEIMTSSVSDSPDGKHIVYSGYKPEGPNFRGYKNTDLWLIEKDGSNPQNITASFDRTIRLYNQSPIWSSDSKLIYFLAPNQGTTNVYNVNISTHKVQQVTKGKREITSFSLGKEEATIIYVGNEPQWPYEVWIHDANGERRLTNLNSEYMKDWELTLPEEFWFEASDGVKIQGWIMKPIDYKEGEKYPTVVGVHGGPMGFYGYGLNHQFQILARHGYAVTYFNPRMSTGYGEKFAAESSGHYGEKDYSDIMEGIDCVIQNYPFVDQERLGEMGHSYGGFMTNWIVGHTDKFKACVTMASISNWDSFHGVSDIGTYWVPWQIGYGKNPWEERQLHTEKAPIFYVDKVNTPLLIMHPEKDYRCPLEQSEQLYVALKKLKKDVEFIIFPDEHHLLPISGKPSHRREWLRHILRWFEKYLKE
jgi:dipeptidyl aminopeptidase/acylaminoacyl peptidase